MNDKYSTTEGKTSEKLSDEAMLSAQWKNIDWHKAEQEVNRLQIRIVKATQQKDYNAVKRLQYLLTHSFYAKALAVKRVVTNDGRKTPGVDGVLWNTPAKKMKAVLSLTDKGYRARPLRRVYIEKKDKKKKRPLGINRTIRSICADYNKEEESKAKEENRDPVLLPKFSCHILRHTFCTRFCENETNLKVIQEIMGHADISTTMDVYAEATQEKKKESMTSLQSALLVR